MKQPPQLIALDHDDRHALDVGVTGDGSQFFLTNPFVPETDEGPGCEYIALYLFDRSGKLLSARIEELGPRSQWDGPAASQKFEELRSSLGEVENRRIVVQPFKIERNGVTFGFVLREPDDADDDWWVTVEPGDYMAFHEPWDSGEYDT